MILMIAANYQKTKKKNPIINQKLNIMKNKRTYLLILISAVVLLIGIYSFTNAYSFETVKSFAGSSISDSTDTKTYTCPMHPEVISDKPGECPKCGMDLELKEQKKIEKKKDEKNDESMDHKNCKGCMHKH